MRAWSSSSLESHLLEMFLHAGSVVEIRYFGLKRFILHSLSPPGYAPGLNMSRLETMNARQHIREGVFGLRRIVIGLQADPETVACTEEAGQT